MGYTLTFATKQAIAVDLSLPDEEWAEYALEMMKKGREDVTDQLREKKMDQSDMIRLIGEVLTS